MDEILTKQRELKYDIIRIVSLLLIVLIHTSAYMVLAFDDPSTKEFAVSNIFNGLSRAGEPLLVMLTGALLLNESKKIETGKFFKSRLLKIIILFAGWMVFFALFYAVILPLLKGEPIALETAWTYFLTYSVSDYPHLWYSFMIIGVYLMVPVLRLFVKKENVKYIIGIIVASLVVQFIPTTLNIFTTNATISVTGFMNKFYLYPVTGYIGYLLLGWLLANYQLKKNHRIMLYIGGGAAVVLSILTVQFAYNDVLNIRSYMYHPFSITAVIFACACFVLISSICKDRQTKNAFVAKLSNNSMGAYLLHVLFLELLVQIILPYTKFGIQSPLLYNLISFGLVVVASYLLVFVISKVKYLRNIFCL